MAFYTAKPADLLPELQGRLPIRVELSNLTEEDMRAILTDPEASLLKQYTALMKVDGVDLDFENSGIDRIAQLSITLNREVENIGARRLHTIIEKLLEEVSFGAPDKKIKQIVIDRKYVDDKLKDIVTKIDLSKFIL